MRHLKVKLHSDIMPPGKGHSALCQLTQLCQTLLVTFNITLSITGFTGVKEYDLKFNNLIGLT